MDETKIVYTLNFRLALKKKGFEPVFEIPNPRKPEFMAWVYERTPAFDEAYEEIYAKIREAKKNEK